MTPQHPAITRSRLPENQGKTLVELGWKPKAGLTPISRLSKFASDLVGRFKQDAAAPVDASHGRPAIAERIPVATVAERPQLADERAMIARPAMLAPPRKVTPPAPPPAPVAVAWHKAKGGAWHLATSPHGKRFATVSKIAEGKNAGRYRAVIKLGEARPAWEMCTTVPKAKAWAEAWHHDHATAIII
jgi:hypothetical protein